jgi:hypothetical protein
MKWFWASVSKFFDNRNGVVRKHANKPNLHWVKAQKPIGEMTEEERQNFSSKLADEIIKNINNK